ncbi:hypothetical protein BT96DRAFT_62760 [Gymnopus androsaceus JB14]|uniref:Uncharacterized protein n=1 Tax=Gymnopus androsaceus JB14 TaxID=1447944 RepID=A0A6A4HKW7_9AGAR|nr:hypothetical protein BT96DRAFT_62760 [Gymnopus androsaceus JB14]
MLRSLQNIKPIYNTILEMLPHLVYLGLCVETWQNLPPYSEGVHSGLSKEAWTILLGKEHREAITAVVPFTDRSANTLRIQVHDIGSYRKNSRLLHLPFMDYSYTK